jgi:hypothetical protein
MQYFFIGWCKEDNHDKVWGIIKLTEGKNKNKMFAPFTDDYLAFWGRRGQALKTKLHKDASQWDMVRLYEKKLNKKDPAERYTEINEAKLGIVYPEFENDLKGLAIWAILSL